MIILIALLPLIAYLSMTAFAGLSWTTKNYEGHQLPYSLGILVIFGYAVFFAILPRTVRWLSHYRQFIM